MRTGFILSMLFLVVCASCKKPASELILGRWKIEDITFPKPDLSKYTDSTRQLMEGDIKARYAIMLATGYYEFEKDGNCVYEEDGMKNELKWRLSPDGKTIYFKEKGSPEELSYTITELTTSLFTFETGKNNGLTRIALKKEVE